MRRLRACSLLSCGFTTVEEFRGGEACWDLCLLGVVVDEMGHGVNGAMHRTTVFVSAAEVLTRRAFVEFCHMKGVFHEFCHTLVFQC